jgi:hypothetical protein
VVKISGASFEPDDEEMVDKLVRKIKSAAALEGKASSIQNVTPTDF